MSIFDWNNDDKNSFFDEAIEYQIIEELIEDYDDVKDNDEVTDYDDTFDNLFKRDFNPVTRKAVIEVTHSPKKSEKVYYAPSFMDLVRANIFSHFSQKTGLRYSRE